MKHGVLIDAKALELLMGAIRSITDEETATEINNKLKEFISSAPSAVILISKAHECMECHANYDGRCMPAQESCGDYAFEHGAPDWCPQITKE